MAKFRAVVDFADLEDNRRPYRAGETYPRDGLTVSEERLAALSGSDNRAGKPLIAAEHDAGTPVSKPAKRRVKRNA